LRLASHNLKLVCWDRNAEDNEELVNTLKEMGSEAFSYVVDVSDRLKVESVANKVLIKDIISLSNTSACILIHFNNNILNSGKI